MNSAKKTDCSGSKWSILSNGAIVAMLLAGALGICAVGAVRSVRAATPAKSTQDGVYTDDQAKRGKAAYTDNCSACHMEDLSGSGQALPLAGDAFTQTWEGQTVNDLFDLVRNTMPQDKPGTLTPETSLDIISYLLQFNHFPAGKDELKNDPDALKNILITTKKPAQ
ncbi:MAG: cytochrome c [Candidatus Acidiferrales bacterium]|jgi:quinoprotein glucose dehydrogenase